MKSKRLLNSHKLPVKKPPSSRYKIVNLIQIQRKHNTLKTMFSHQKVLQAEKSIFRISEQQKGQTAQLTKFNPVAKRYTRYLSAHAVRADVHRDVTSSTTTTTKVKKRSRKVEI